MITSTRNAAVKAARRLARPGTRSRGDAFLVEGPQAVREALEHLHQLFASGEALDAHADLVGDLHDAGVEVIEVSDEVLAALADARTPQGLVGVASLAQPALDVLLGAAQIVVVGVGLADPGNVGTIVRSADAAGADGVVLTTGSCDAANPKAVRASAGSIFHVPVVQDVAAPAVLRALRDAGLTSWAAHADAPQIHTDADLAGRVALVVGSEAHGLDPDTIAACDAQVAVPLRGRAESLNVAATVAVLAYEALRQREAAPGGAA